MPTGYTNCIDGKTTFKEFALKCARAFGACITMRDNNMDDKIPKKFECDPYYTEEIDRIKKEIERIENMPPEELERMAREEYFKNIDSNNEIIKEIEVLKKNYEDMLSKVRNWMPPTKDHFNLKKFMADQIESSIDGDCNLSYYKNIKLELLSGEEWKSKELEILKESLKRNEKYNEEEIKRVEGRNKWIKKLRESLNLK